MADAFISYSRKDVNFVRGLVAALKAADKDVWVDLENILPTAEWLAEIFDGIDGANNFVFVISPDSVTSQVCSLEIAHAVKNSKRLIPIVRRDVDQITLLRTMEEDSWEGVTKEHWDKLRAINWIFFRKTDDFSNALGKLLEAIDIDPDHVRLHTDLLADAIEWDRKGRKGSDTLRGPTLEEAESWLKASYDKDPQPTELQISFIGASRKAVDKQRRITIGSITAALIITLVLCVAAIIAVIGFSRQSELAQTEASIARSRELATRALSLLENPKEYDVALLLCVEAFRHGDTYEARDSLLTALQREGRPIGYIYPEESALDNLPPWNLEGGSPSDPSLETRRTAILDIIEEETGSEGWVSATATSPNGRYFAVGLCPIWEGLSFCSSNEIRIYSLESGEEINRINQGHENIVFALAFGPDGTMLASGSDDQTLRIWDFQSGHELKTIPHSYPVVSVAFSPDGDLIATGTSTASNMVNEEKLIRLWDVATGELQETLEGHRNGVYWLEFSPDGTILASWDSDLASRYEGTILLWNVSGNSSLLQHVDSSDESIGNYFDLPQSLGESKGREIMAVSNAGNLRALDVGCLGTVVVESSSTGEFVAGFAIENAPTTRDPGRYAAAKALFSPDGQLLVTYHEFETQTWVWSIEDWSPEASGAVARIDRYDTALDIFAFSQDGLLLAAGGCLMSGENCGADIIYLWDVATQQFLGQPLVANQGVEVERLAFSPKGDLIAQVGGSYVVWEVAPKSLIQRACHIVNRNLTEHEWALYLGTEDYRETCPDVP